MSIFFLPACGTLLQSREEQERMLALMDQRLDERDFRIDIDYMMPLRGGGRVVTGSYAIIVDGTSINSHLPYVGVVYNVPYGGGKVLTFKDDIDEYADRGWERGRRTISFSTNNDEDILIYTLTVSEDGRTDVHVRCRNREDISYRGLFSTEAEEEAPSPVRE